MLSARVRPHLFIIALITFLLQSLAVEAATTYRPQSVAIAMGHPSIRMPTCWPGKGVTAHGSFITWSLRLEPMPADRM